VSGVSTVSGLHPATPGDEAEIYYPSRGIPQKVADNVYSIQKVEYTVAVDEAQTKIDWGLSEPSTGDMIKATSSTIQGGGGGGGGGFTQFLRNDLSETTQQTVDQGQTQGGAFAGGFPLVGTIKEANDNGTFDVQGEDGNLYENVRVI